MGTLPTITCPELHDLLDGFRGFLSHAWPHRPTWDEGCWQETTAEEEWIISHWEILVEYPLQLRFGEEFLLDTYGHPGDEEYRGYRCGEWATHTIIVNRAYVFQSFWSNGDQAKMERPPFHLVLGEPIKDGADWLAEPFDAVKFSLEPCEYAEQE